MLICSNCIPCLFRDIWMVIVWKQFEKFQFSHTVQTESNKHFVNTVNFTI